MSADAPSDIDCVEMEEPDVVRYLTVHDGINVVRLPDGCYVWTEPREEPGVGTWSPRWPAEWRVTGVPLDADPAIIDLGLRDAINGLRGPTRLVRVRPVGVCYICHGPVDHAAVEGLGGGQIRIFDTCSEHCLDVAHIVSDLMSGSWSHHSKDCQARRYPEVEDMDGG
jgi:hypothetical protein